jgi:hypothetical protein
VTIVGVGSVLGRELSLLYGRRRDCELPLQLLGGLGGAWMEGFGRFFATSNARIKVDSWELVITRPQGETGTFGGSARFNILCIVMCFEWEAEFEKPMRVVWGQVRLHLRTVSSVLA